MLQLKNITKNYYVGSQVIPALKGISLDFRKNEFVSILGPSGCGKTTLMNIIGGLDKYTKGDLAINGKSTTDFKDRDWDNYRNRKIGFVFQNYNLIHHSSILANVELALTISGISKSERSKRAKEALHRVHLEDQVHKKPNQLSGGQMQRVAIARAIVNNPEILLLDEPTGALDTETSEQILDLIKELAQNTLVIMVTHNPDLANKYSTRMIKMVDGNILSDSVPYDCSKDAVFQNEVSQQKVLTEITKDKKEKAKTKMSFLTALSLSFRNLVTKKGRTILTAIAGSIGIIGIAVILAISNGMTNYIDKMQADTLSSSPITITTSTVDVNQAMNAMGNSKKWEEFPGGEKIFVEEASGRQLAMITNDINQGYIDYLTTNLKSEWYNDILYKTGITLNVYGIKNGQTTYSKVPTQGSSNMVSAFTGSGDGGWQQLLKEEFLDTQYDVLSGHMPTNKNEIVLIVDEFNKMEEETLIDLGLKVVGDEIKEYNFADILNHEFKILQNDEIYTKSGSQFIENSPLDINFAQAETLTISGILRINRTTDMGVLSSGIGYSSALTSWLQEENSHSQIVTWMNDNPNNSPHTGLAYEPSLSATTAAQREADFRKLGGEKVPNEISIYPVNFEAKNSIIKVLDDYNIGKAEENMVTYSDLSELMGEMISSIVNIITYVLIAFTAISLVVSCVMISIITYVSVLERTKEIGILRSIGARKKDVTRVFNAETFIIGLFAGLIGITVAYLLSIPINIIIQALAGVTGIASLSIVHALLLIVISIVLTLFSGLIPANKASKKDPVLALRSE